MKNLFFLLLFSVALFSCNTSKHIVAPTPTPTFERVITITKQVHDTVLVVKADTVRLAAKLVTDTATGKIFIKGKPKASTTNGTRANHIDVNIDADNNLVVDCFCDTVGIRFGYTETSKIDSSKLTIYPPPQIIEKPLTKWQWVQLLAGRLFLLLLLLILGIKVYNVFIKK